MNEKHILDPACQDPKQDTLILLEDAIGEIDDDLIQSVEALRQQRDALADLSLEETSTLHGVISPQKLSTSFAKKIMRRETYKWASLAACLCLFIGAGFLWALGGSLAAKSESVADHFYSEDDIATVEMEALSEELSDNKSSQSTSLETLPATGYVIPSLYLNSSEDSISALQGAYYWCWNHTDGSLTHAKADSEHPLALQDLLPRIHTNDPSLMITLVDSIEPPHEISIQCWSESYWDDDSAPSTNIPVENGKFSLLEGGYIYEITVSWDRGTVRYAFYACYTPTSP